MFKKSSVFVALLPLVLAACGNGAVLSGKSDGGSTQTASIPSCASPRATVRMVGTIMDLPGGMGKIPNDPVGPVAEKLKSTGCVHVVMQQSNALLEERQRAGLSSTPADYVIRATVTDGSNGIGSSAGTIGLGGGAVALFSMIPYAGMAVSALANQVKTDDMTVALEVTQVRTGRTWNISGNSSNWRVTHAFALMGGGFMNDNPELGNAASAAVAKFFQEVMPVSQVASSAPRAPQAPQVQRTKAVVTAASSRN